MLYIEEGNIELICIERKVYDKLYDDCNSLRGDIEPLQYRKYILTLFFAKCVSGSYAENWNINVPTGGSFDDIVAMKNCENIGEGINVILRRLAEANDLNGTIEVIDFSSEEIAKEQCAIDKLSSLVDIFNDFSIDFFDDWILNRKFFCESYEYLSYKFAIENQNRGYETPKEISIIMSELIGINRVTESGKTFVEVR